MWLVFLACAPPSTDLCIDLDAADGSATIEVGDALRRVAVRRPRGIQDGLPVLVFWHGQGQNADEMASRASLGQVAQDAGLIAVVPDSSDRDGETWDVTDDSADVALFETLVDCLVHEHGADADRVHVAGFSFGGFLSTFLLLTESEALASATVFSGGLDGEILPYQRPETRVPVLVAWGGTTDVVTNGGTPVRFGELSRNLVDGLVGDDHLVIVCDHGAGHRIPDATPEILTAWAGQHVRGQPSPWVDGLDALPPYCVPAGG